MPFGGALLFGLIVGGAAAAEGGPRYGIEPDLNTYPQKTPREALASVVKAAEEKRFDYLVAQLADPAFIDDRVRRVFGGRFDQQVEDTRTRLDAPAMKLLRRFLKDGEWKAEGGRASARLKDVTDRAVFLREARGRWYLEHRYTPEQPPREQP
jgi:hypothetical protein